jgi:RimJ/RimL family protein N-acetyltransferase
MDDNRNQPCFESARLDFRPWQESENWRRIVSTAMTQCCDFSVMELNVATIYADQSWARVMQIARRVESADRGGLWAVVERSSAEVIGSVMLMSDPDGDLELAYHVSQHSWNQGYGYEMAKALLDLSVEAGT